MLESTARLLFAWSAGLAFVASLAYFAYFYFIPLGQPVHHALTVRNLLINLGLFGVFALHHSLMARSGLKRWISRWIPEFLERAVYVWVASVLFFAVCALWRPLPGMAYDVRGAARWLFLGVQTAGILLIARTASTLDPRELAGIEHACGPRRHGSSVAASSPKPELNTEGPYRFVRHPLYLGWILLVFGTPRMTAGRLAFAAISTAYLLVAIPWEERSLLATFGEAYRRYSERVRWRILPYVY